MVIGKQFPCLISAYELSPSLFFIFCSRPAEAGEASEWLGGSLAAGLG